MTDPRIVPCEYCGTEGRVYVREDYYDRQYGWHPGKRDLGPCEACEGTGGEIVETEPITLEDLDRPFFECPDCGKDVANSDEAHAPDCPRGKTCVREHERG